MAGDQTRTGIRSVLAQAAPEEDEKEAGASDRTFAVPPV